MISDISKDTLQRWRTSSPDSREHLHRLLLENLYPSRLRRLLSLEALPRTTQSPFWFVWRAIQLAPMPQTLSLLAEALPEHRADLEALAESWQVSTPSGRTILLEFAAAGVMVRDLEDLLEGLLEEVGTPHILLTGLFSGEPHLSRDITTVMLNDDVC